MQVNNTHLTQTQRCNISLTSLNTPIEPIYSNFRLKIASIYHYYHK